MDGQFYASSFADFKAMGCDGAAVEVLREGLAAVPDCPQLLELARREGISASATPAPAAPMLPAATAAAAAPPPATAAPTVQVADWRPPPPPRPSPERVGANPAVQKLFDALDAVAMFTEADASTWAALREGAGGQAEELLAQERCLRAMAVRAFDECKGNLARSGLEARTELLRPPCTPDFPSAVQDACGRGGPHAALREVAGGACPGAFEGDLWDLEGPGAYLQLAQRLSASEAPLARAREIARTGPGTLHALLGAVAQEAAAAVQALPQSTAQVLVIGGHGASAVAAARAGAGRVAVWERNPFVASTAEEALQRNLAGEELQRCSVLDTEQPPEGSWDVVAVDLWQGVSALSGAPFEALQRVQAACGGRRGRVVPAKLLVEVALADGRLTSTSGFDLSGLDSRFRGLSAAPLRLELADDAEAHPTSLQPLLLTETVAAFELDLSQGPGAAAAEDGPVALRPRGLCSGLASMAVVSLRFQLGQDSDGQGAVLRFGQWLPGGYSVAEGSEVAGLSARRGPSRVWVDWDWGRSEEPPMGHMALSDWYYEMLRDGARHDAYDRALRAEVAAARARKGACRVLDVGSGDGILSMMALRAGATAGVGVEVVTAIARLSEQIIALNRRREGHEDAPLPPDDEAPLDIWCTDVRGVSRPPESLKFDVLVSELMDAGGLGENLILLTRGARQRLCHEGAPVIPARLRLLAVLCEVRLPALAGVNMDALWPFWPAGRLEEGLWIGVDLDKREGDFRILTEPTELLSLELGVADVHDVPPRKEVDLSGTTDGTANCVVWWFEAQLSRADPSVVLTNAPKCVDSRHAATCWGQAMAELQPCMEVKQGALAEVTMEVPFGDYQLKFRPRTAAAGSRAAQRKPSATPSPSSRPYSERFVEGLEEYRRFQAETQQFTRGHPIGQNALRTANIGALSVLQRTALCVASQPGLFGVEPSVAAKMLSGWYSVGGEGRV
uniref:Protein arginine N-methyltransferase n=1 Tax=Alexandrium monilatum TaxID=311494 RepID=A0A7S4WF44_9DINO